MKLRGGILATTAVCALGAAVSGNAATVTTCGPNVCYEYDNAQAAVGLTGQPNRVGDSMQFLPPNFVAESIDGQGLVTASASFVFSRVYTVNAADEISLFNVSEEFDYEIITDGEVGASLTATALSNVLGSDTTTDSDSFSATGDTFGSQIGGLFTTLNPAAAFTGSANDMQITIANLLSADTNAGGDFARIQKRFTLVTNTVMAGQPVPVPAAVWLLGSAVGLLGVLRRRMTR
jgi:hypothetical protein